VNRRPAAAERSSHGPHRSRTDATRALLLDTAEKLFAEHGIAAVSNRQVAEAAGQANNSVARSHSDAMEGRRRELVAAARGSSDLYEHVACLVRPLTEHLAALGSPSWCARFTAQAQSDPVTRQALELDSMSSPSLRTIVDSIRALAPELPLDTVLVRGQMARSALVHTCAERELALARHSDVDTELAWQQTADALIDAMVGLLGAPVRR
jgi:AcrR family transcriptional regulator